MYDLMVEEKYFKQGTKHNKGKNYHDRQNVKTTVESHYLYGSLRSSADLLPKETGKKLTIETL